MDALGEGRAAEKSLPRLSDYELARATFSWKAAAEELAGLPGGHGLNITYEAVHRHGGSGF
jgi:hypothetical protein